MTGPLLHLDDFDDDEMCGPDGCLIPQGHPALSAQPGDVQGGDPS